MAEPPGDHGRAREIRPAGPAGRPVFSLRSRPSWPSVRSSHVAHRPSLLFLFLFVASVFAAASGCGGASLATPGDTVAFDACAALPLVLDPDINDAQSAGITAAM